MLTLPEDVFCVGGKLEVIVKDCAQVFVLLNYLDQFSLDRGGNCCSLLPLPVGERHHPPFGLLNIQLQAGVIAPLRKLMQS